MHQNQVGKPFATGCQGKFEKFAILTFTEEQLNIVLHLEIDNNTALSYLLKSAGPFGITFSANKLHFLRNTFPVL